jgi:tetratricopeptide (TPR) repeat protein
MIAGAAALAGAQGPPAEQLKKAVVQEETGQSPEKAIEAYRAIVAQYDEDRRVAATALYRLAETCRKAGMRTEAQAAYQRVVREFSDQTALADPSRRQLMDTFGVSESRTTRESQDMLRMQRDLAAAREELERSRASELRATRELSTRYERSPRAMSIEEARLELAMTERRMADIKAKVEIGTSPKSALDEMMLQYEKDKVRYEQLLAERENIDRERQASQALSQQTLKSVQAEMKLIEAQLQTMQRRVETGMLSPADPQILQLQRDLLALQRKSDELSAGMRK